MNPVTFCISVTGTTLPEIQLLCVPSKRASKRNGLRCFRDFVHSLFIKIRSAGMKSSYHFLLRHFSGSIPESPYHSSFTKIKLPAGDNWNTPEGRRDQWCITLERLSSRLSLNLSSRFLPVRPVISLWAEVILRFFRIIFTVS